MLFPDTDSDNLYIHRTDPEEPLGSFSLHAFTLDGKTWPSVEHYFQAMKFESVAQDHFERILNAESPKQARKLGRSRFKKLRPDWAKVKRVVMTRAIYTQCKTHASVAKALLETDERKILEASQYDYYWGCGRDRRGENVYGQVLMDVRKKLQQEASEEDGS